VGPAPNVGLADLAGGYLCFLQIVKDFSATSLIGPLASTGQMTNAALISCLYHLSTTLEAAVSDFSVKALEALLPPVQVRLVPRM